MITATPHQSSASQAAVEPEPARHRPRLRKALKIIGAILTTLLVAVAGVAYWALDRYVIDHVEVADVAAYEASVASAPPPAQNVNATSEVGEPTAVAKTATSYTRDGLSISISKVETGAGATKVTYYVADVVVTDGTAIRGGFAQNKFGRNIIEDPSDIAADNGAIFAINGDYYGYRTTGIVIRNGVLYRDEGARIGLALYRDGAMAVYDERETTGEQLLAAGVWNTLSFGPALVDGGAIVAGIDKVEIDTNIGNHSIQGNQPRSGVGLIDEGHFVFVVVDGRSTGYSRGVTMTEFAEIFRSLGVKVAYNLDGGGSAVMVFDGELVNNPLGKGDERGISDILYIA